MEYHFSSFQKLEQELNTYSTIEERVERLSTEIFRCRNMLADIRCNLHLLSVSRIIFEQNDELLISKINEILKKHRLDDILEKDVIDLLKDKLIFPYEHFLDKANSLRDYFNAIKGTQKDASITKTYKQFTCNEYYRIIWKRGMNKLIKIFYLLYVNGFLHQYKKEEILAHFMIEGQNSNGYPLHKSIPIKWFKSDSSFAVLINEFSKRGCINNRWKYKICCEHFVDKNGNPFQYLAQKKNYIESVTHKGSSEIINKILDSANIKKMLPFLCFLIKNLELISDFIWI